MKNNFLFYLIIFCNLGFAQNPELFDNNWYLEKFVIDNVDIPQTNQSDFYHFINFQDTNEDIQLSSYYCQIHLYFVCSTITDTNFAYNEIISPQVYCEEFNVEDIYMRNINNDFYITDNNTFNYVVNDIAGVNQLIITNSLNNQAIYYNVNLSTEGVIANKSLEIYPNPVEDVININIKIDIDNINLYGIDGKWIQSFENNSENKIDVSGLKAGIYFIEIRTADKLQRQKFIKN